jgi:secreted trypsin-like serine protease
MKTRLFGMAAVTSLIFLSPNPSLAHESFVAQTPESTHDWAQARIYGGSPATGNPGIAALAINTGSAWNSSCSAVVWKPRILLTAAHCVTAPGGTANVAGIGIFPPGGTAIQYSNTGPQGATGIQVTQIIKPASYVNASTRVEPNDFAILVLNADIGAGYFNRLATSAEMTRWARDLYPGTVMGYGLTGPNQRPTIPMQAQVPIDTYEPRSSLGPVFSVGQDASVGVCSGDSGGPTFATNPSGERLLLGVNSGSAGGCVAGFLGSYLMVGFTAIDYLDLVNQALTIAGYPTIPSAPTATGLQAVNDSVVVSWQPPLVSPSTVTSYEVVSADGTVACTTTQLSCTVPGLPPGEYSFTVRALNAQGEGNALPASLTASVVPPGQMAAPRITGKKIQFTTLARSTSAVVTQYRIIDARGKRICTLKDFSSTATRLSCPLPKQAGAYRFRVLAVTEMGNTTPSGLSRKVVIS